MKTKSMMAALLIAAMLTLSGCNAYMLRGKVIRGEVPSVELVYAGDERLEQTAVSGVEVRITRDPNNPNRHLVGQARSDASGGFTVVMDEFGTGWMQESWLVQAHVPGYQNAESMLELPSKNTKWRLLITMPPGMSEPLRDDDLMQDLERFK